MSSNRSSADFFSILGDADRTEPLEIVERKGFGHPDSICDALSEALSVNLLRYYVHRYGRSLHYNVDKILLVAGEARVAFGGGQLLSPLKVCIAGRATAPTQDAKLDLQRLARETVAAFFTRYFPNLRPERDYLVQADWHPGSAELIALFSRADGGVALANDSSVGVGYAPLSPLEQLVLELDRDLQDIHRSDPWLGLDSKILAIRRGMRLELSVACAMVAKHIHNVGEYLANKARLHDKLQRRARQVFADSELAINAADDPESGDVYLTISGSSAEAGDDGETGRGNRGNGLITPMRPMTIEALAGKNCITHTGKLYSLAAQRIASSVIAHLPTVKTCVCYLVSRIGAPITQPALLHLSLTMRDSSTGSLSPQIQTEAEAIAMQNLNTLPELWREVLVGGIQVS